MSATIQNITTGNLVLDGNLPLRVDLKASESITIRDSVYELNRELIEQLVADGKLQVTVYGNVDQRVCQNVAEGVNNDVVALDPPVRDVVSMLAFVTADGSPATKCLLTSGTDYNVTGSADVEVLTDQTANTLVITYHEFAQNEVTIDDATTKRFIL